jgi:GTPase Era involved in 16S rRNA processing
MNFIVENYFWISIAFSSVIVLGIVLLVIRRISKKDDNDIEKPLPERKIKEKISFIDLVDELADLLSQFNFKHKELESSINVLKIIKESPNSPLLVVVLGEFSSGKSTFINALLKEQLLAMKIRPTTATITQLQYGKKPEMHVHYLDGKVEKKDLGDLNIFTVENYIKDNNILNEVYYVQLQLENNFLAKIDIADTPGFNSSIERHTEITSEFIAHADVVFWLFDANQMLKGTEVNILEKYCKNFKPIAIINKADTLGLNDNNTVMEELNGSIEKISDFIEKVFPVSAKMALNSQNGEYEQSGMQDIVDYFHSDIIPNGAKTKERMAHIKFAQVAYTLDLVRKEIEKKLEQPKKIINYVREKESRVHEGIRKYEKSIDNWNEDLKSDKDNMYPVENLQRYFLVDKVPSDVTNMSKSLIRSHSKLSEDNKRIDKWSDSKEQDRIKVDEMYDDLTKRVNEYNDKLGKQIVDSISVFFTGSDFTDEKTKINTLVDDYDNLSEEFNSDVNAYNSFLNKTNEKWDELNNDVLEFLNKTVLQEMNSQKDGLQKIEAELFGVEKQIKKNEKEFNILNYDLRILDNNVVHVFMDFERQFLNTGDKKQATILNGFDSLIGHFKSISTSNSDLDWKKLYSRSKIQDLINIKRAVITKTYSQSKVQSRENRKVNKI